MSELEALPSRNLLSPAKLELIKYSYQFYRLHGCFVVCVRMLALCLRASTFVSDEDHLSSNFRMLV